MHGLPEILREFRTGCCPLGRHCERPAITVFYRLRVFLAVLEQPPDPRLLPRIEYGYAQTFEEFLYAASPAETFLSLTARNKVHRAGEIDTRAMKVVMHFSHVRHHKRAPGIRK